MQHSYYTNNRIHREQIITQHLLSAIEYWLSSPKYDNDSLRIEYNPTKADEIYLKLYGYKVEFFDSGFYSYILPIC